MVRPTKYAPRGIVQLYGGSGSSIVTGTSSTGPAGTAGDPAGTTWKAPVRVATTTNGTLATAYENGDTVDGIVLATGDRLLIKDQTDGTENGIYVVQASGEPVRASDMNDSAEVVGSVIYVIAGTVNRATTWASTNLTPPVIGFGFDALTFGPFGVDWFVVTRYGAAGDGVADDTTEVQAAIDAAEANGGGVVYFPAGTYLISAKLTVDSDNVSLIGAGPLASVLKATAGFTTGTILELNAVDDCVVSMLGLSSPSIKTGGVGIALVSVNRVTLEQLHIQKQYDAIKATTSFVLRMQNLDIRDTSRHGIWFDGATGNDWYLSKIVADNAVDATGEGIYISGGDALFAEDCDFLHFSHGLLIQPTSGRTSEWHFLTACAFDKSTTDGIHIGSAAGNIYGVTLVNCWGSSNGGQGCYIGGGSGSLSGVTVEASRFFNNDNHGIQVVTPATKVLLADNTCVSNSIASSGTYDGINVAAAVTQLTVRGNMAYNGLGLSSTQGYGLNFVSGAGDYILAQGNNFTGNVTGTIGNIGGVTGANVIASGNMDVNVWKTYTPAWTSSGTPPAIGNGTLAGRYKLFDNTTMHVIVNLVWGSTTTTGTGTYQLGLPSGFPIYNDTSIDQVGSARILDSGTAHVAGIAYGNPAGTALYCVFAWSSANQIWANNYPIATPATGDTVTIGMTYRYAK